ncbi:hypothetical protein HYU13_00550 [Candidatus Woesearchaeota archaeon]|nr:hypothetical protein [Candidatus Woesearchaeota archaeon]
MKRKKIRLVNNLRVEDIFRFNSMHPRIIEVQKQNWAGLPLDFHLTADERYRVVAVTAEHLPEPIRFFQSFPGMGGRVKGQVVIGFQATPRLLDSGEAIEYLTDVKARQRYDLDKELAFPIGGVIDEIPSFGAQRTLLYLKKNDIEVYSNFPFFYDLKEVGSVETYAVLNINQFALPGTVLGLMEGIKPEETMVWLGRCLVKRSDYKHWTEGREGFPDVGHYCRETFDEVAYFRCEGKKNLGVLLIDNARLGD